MALGWCENGYPEWFFGKDGGYGLGAAPHGSCLHGIQKTIRDDPGSQLVGTDRPSFPQLRRCSPTDRDEVGPPIYHTCSMHVMHIMHTPLTHVNASTAAAHACMSHEHHTHCSLVITRLPAWHTLAGLLILNLPCCVESPAATHKCHFRVRHFGRVFALPYKKWQASRNGLRLGCR